MASRELQTLALASITCEQQVRETFDVEAIAELAQSLVSVGLQQPILVRREGDGYVVIDGERRFRAAKVARWETIEALVEDGEGDDATRIVRQLVANCQRTDLSPIEMAKAIDGLMETAGLTGAEAAATLGLKPSWVTRSVALLSLPEAVQARVHAGQLAASTAYQIAKTKDEGQRDALISDAVAGVLTRDAAERRSRAASKPKSAGGPRATRKTRPTRKRKTTLRVMSACSIAVTGETVQIASLVSALEGVCRELRASGLAGDVAVSELADLFKARSVGQESVGQHPAREAEGQ